MNIVAALFLIIFEAVYEGLRDRGKKTIAGVIEFIYLSVITLIVYAWLSGYLIFHVNNPLFILTIGGYVLVRYALFDPVYNKCRGNDLWYIGNTKIYDKLLGWFFRWTKFPKEDFLPWTRLIALAIGIVWLLRGTW